jgi:hypothetical protein
MADRILNENSATDGLLLEDGSGVLLLEVYVAPTSVPNAFMMMGIGNWAILFLMMFL